MNTQDLLTLLIAIVTATGGALTTWIVNWLKSKQVAKAYAVQETTNVTEIQKRMNGNVLRYCAEVEQEYKGASGEVKKYHVLKKIARWHEKNGCQYDMHAWDNEVDQVMLEVNKIAKGV